MADSELFKVLLAIARAHKHRLEHQHNTGLKCPICNNSGRVSGLTVDGGETDYECECIQRRYTQWNPKTS